MADKRVPDNDDALGELGPVIETIRAGVPNDAQWAAIHERLGAALERASPASAAPSARSEPRQPSRSRTMLPWLATAAALLAVAGGVWLVNRVPNVSPHPTTDKAVGQVEQAYAVFVRRKDTDGERPLDSNDVIRAGDALRVAPQGSLDLRLEDGSRLWLTAGTEAECVGPRSDDAPAWRLTRGEIQADIAPASKRFRIATPRGGLRVLGTRFHVRVYPNEEPGFPKEKMTMKSGASFLQRAIVVLTVLSGSVALECNGQEKVVTEGRRATVSGGSTTSAGTTQIEELRKWVGKRMNRPGTIAPAEVLVALPLREGLLSRLFAINAETGKSRYVTDFVGGYARIDAHFGSGLALGNPGSVLYSRSAVAVNSGHPLIEDAVLLVDTAQGDKVALPLEGWDPMYPTISPDGRKVAMVGTKRTSDGKWEGGLLVGDLEAFTPTKAYEGFTKQVPAWSPDSRWVAISKAEGYQTEGHEIVLVDTLEGTVKGTGLKGAGARFSPDGKQLVFAGDFKPCGSWYRGVPTSGNLFLATLPDGKPEQITHQLEGGAVEPLFSADGSQLAYWERPRPEERDWRARLHVLDMATKRDSTVLTVSDLFEVRWLDAQGTKLLLYPMSPSVEDWKNGQMPVKTVQRQGEGWAVSERKIDLPKVVEDGSVEPFAERLMDVFEAHRAGLRARDLHQLEEAHRQYILARDQAAALVQDLERGTGQGIGAVKLQPIDVRPYQEAMAKKAAVAPQDLGEQVVRSSLEFYLSILLGHYYADHDRFPPSETEAKAESRGETAAKRPTFEQFCQNPPKGWSADYFRDTDRDLIRRWFVVPGDDPNQKATSYEVVRSGKDALVLRTPVLANGKRLEATYEVADDRTFDVNGKKERYVRVKATIAEVK